MRDRPSWSNYKNSCRLSCRSGWMMDGWLSRMWIESKVVDRCLLLNQLNVLIDVNERSHKLLAAFVRATGSRHFSVAEQRSEGETEGGIDVGREHGSQWVSCDPAPLMKSFFFCHLSPLLSSLSPPPSLMLIALSLPMFCSTRSPHSSPGRRCRGIRGD